MKTFVILAALLVSPVVASAEDARPPVSQPQDARLVPAMRDGKFVGIKIYAIRPGGRFDAAKFLNGDTILAVDDVPVTTDAGTHALHDKVIEGRADAIVTVTRGGATVQLTSKAK